MGKNKEVIKSEDDCEIYSGCFVNAKINLWAQKNTYGKRINCELIAIQFASDGEALDGVSVSTDKAMEGFEAEGADDDFMAA